MSRHQLNRLDTLERHFDSEFVHYDDLKLFWQGCLQAWWDAATTHVHPSDIRALMDDFAARVKALELPAPSTRK